MPDFEAPGHYTKSDRESIPDEDFAGPHKSYPIVTQADVHDAAGLIGHADDPASVKARIKTIARRKGFALPAAWEQEDTPEGQRLGLGTLHRSPVGTITRIAMADALRIVDPEQRIIRVCATSEAVDTYGTIFDYDASKRAFSAWVGNVREMHERKAVGYRVSVIPDDANRKIYVDVGISKGAPDTWEKVQDTTLRGASIGAANALWERRLVAGRARDVCINYDLMELSLVDFPSNPDGFGMQVRDAVPLIRDAAPASDVLDRLEDNMENEGPTIVGDDGKEMTPEEAAAKSKQTAQAAPEADNRGHAVVKGTPGTAPVAAQMRADAAVASALVGALTNTDPNVQVRVGGEPDGQQAPEIDPLPVAAEQPVDGVLEPQRAAEVQLSPEQANQEALDDPLWAVVKNKPDSPVYKRMLRDREAGVIRMAGERAAAEAGPPVGGEPIQAWIQRTALVRNKAELQARTKFRTEQSASDEARRLAVEVAQIAQEATPPAPVAPVAPVVEQQRTAETVAPVVAAVAAVAAPSAPAADPVADQRMAQGAAPHQHGNGAPHTHPFSVADHIHGYLEGAPYDLRLGQGSVQRARANGNTTNQGGDQFSTGAVGAANSGSDVTSENKAPSVFATATADKMGHTNLINTEAAMASSFGVPDKVAQPDATPGNGPDGGEHRTHNDNTRTEGEHPVKLTGGTYDGDGDDDGDEEDKPQSSGGTSPNEEEPIGGPARQPSASPTKEKPIGGAARQPSKSPSDAGTIGGGAMQSGNSPTDEEPIGGGARQTSTSPNEGRPIGGSREAEAEEIRVGARLSAASQAQVHDMRDTHIGMLRKSCTLCNCPECQAMQKLTGVMAGHPGGGAASTDQMNEDFGRAVISAEIERGVAVIRGAFDARIADLMQTLGEVAQRVAGPSAVPATTAVGGVQFTLPTADEIRAAFGPTIESVLTPLVQQVRSSAAEAAETMARVEAFANSPQTETGPAAHGLVAETKRTALSPAQPGQQGSAGGDLTQRLANIDARIAPLAEEAERSGNAQLQMQVANLVLQRQQLAAGKPMPGIPQFGNGHLGAAN